MPHDTSKTTQIIPMGERARVLWSVVVGVLLGVTAATGTYATIPLAAMCVMNWAIFVFPWSAETHG